MKPKVILICDMQFGSTGKGLIAGYLAKHLTKPDTVMCAFAPNAGHTFIDASGRKFVHRMIPNGIVSPNLKRVMIGPGAVVDPELLDQEVEASINLLAHVDVVIHEHAAMVTEYHAAEERAQLVGIGSTMKGTAAANIQKMMRQGGFKSNIAKNYTFKHARVVTHEEYCAMVDDSKVIQLEGAQGYSLGMNSGMYPYVTSRECTPAQMLSDCVIPIDYLHQTIGTLRTYPIRVANRYNEQGVQVGTSGPGYPDQLELGWEDMGLEPELTTVTKLPRRIFTFSRKQFKQALRACAPDFIFLNFCNYAKTGEELSDLVDFINLSAGHKIVRWEGYGPTETDITVNFIPYSAKEHNVEESNRIENDKVIR